MEILAPQHLLLVALIFVLLFGSKRLPELARSLRRARDEFEGKTDGEDDPPSN
jgi:TatA/E family protein of Tat protein translocase